MKLSEKSPVAATLEAAIERKGEDEEEGKQEPSERSEAAEPVEDAAVESRSALRKPFQRLQFLVRDWQNFDVEYSEGAADEVFQRVLSEMQSYLDGVLRPRNASDLQSTRDQILRCFEKLDCFLLPHPGNRQIAT